MFAGLLGVGLPCPAIIFEVNGEVGRSVTWPGGGVLQKLSRQDMSNAGTHVHVPVQFIPCVGIDLTTNVSAPAPVVSRTMATPEVLYNASVALATQKWRYWTVTVHR